MPVLIRLMRIEDIEFAMLLQLQAGWNQTREDWERFLNLTPEGCFLAEYQGQPVGTTIVCPFGDTAWIAMVLVHASFRRRGIGRALVEHALRYLESLRVPTIRLDATPLGRPLYERLGFSLEYHVTRFSGLPAPWNITCDATVRVATDNDLDEVCQLDRLITGADRRQLLAAWWKDRTIEKQVAEEGGHLRGYALSRPGIRARFIGPILGQGDAAIRLLYTLLSKQVHVPTYIDVPEFQEDCRRIVEAAGLVPERPLYRMWLGVRPREMRACLWASSGPECG